MEGSLKQVQEANPGSQGRMVVKWYVCVCSGTQQWRIVLSIIGGGCWRQARQQR